MKCKSCKCNIEKWKEVRWNLYTYCTPKHRQEHQRELARKQKEKDLKKREAEKKREKKEKVLERKAKKREEKKTSIAVLTKKLDKIVSEYIRKRDCLLTTWTITHWVCITCWEKKEYSHFDAGNFVSRANRATRWNEFNISLQCKVCNCWGWWRQYEHWIALDKKWGQWTAQRLIEDWKQVKIYKSWDLLDMIMDFITKLWNLK